MISVPVWSQTILRLKGTAIGFLYRAGIHVAPRTNLNGFGDLLTFTLMSASAFYLFIFFIHIYLFEHCQQHLNVLILVLCTFLLMSCICRTFSLLHPVAVHFPGYEVSTCKSYLVQKKQKKKNEQKRISDADGLQRICLNNCGKSSCLMPPAHWHLCFWP